jgi:hypothetical protein
MENSKIKPNEKKIYSSKDSCIEEKHKLIW